jgi:hypothetical protein
MSSSRNVLHSACVYFIGNFREIMLFFINSAYLLRRYSSDVRYTKNKDGIINILGNGPSCHDTFNRNLCMNEKIMVVNFTAITDVFFEYKPEFYVLIDPSYFEVKSDKFILLYEKLAKVDWSMTLFVPTSYRKQAEALVCNPNIILKFINFNYLPGKSKAVFNLYQRNIASPRFQNVLIACLYVSINIGFKEIKLHGVEHSEFQMYEINEYNEVLINQKHFYGSDTINLTKEGKILKGEFWKYLQYYSFMLEAYSQMKSYSDFLRCNIVNYTKKSFIDSFDKK